MNWTRVYGGAGSPVSTARRPLIGNIQALRAIAVLMVGVMHAFQWQAARHQDAVLDILAKATTIGQAGVDIFFVISGFVITTIGLQAAEDAKPGLNPRIAGVFALHRILRIYPLFWIVLVCSVAMIGSAAEFTANPTKLLLVPPPGGLLAVSWTLEFEICFYVVAALALLLWARRFVLIVALATVAHIVLNAMGMLHTALTVPIIYEFTLGCAAAVLIERGVDEFSRGALIAAIGGFIAGSVVFLFPPSFIADLNKWRLLLFGVPAMLLVYGLAALERTEGVKLPGWLQRRGTESYSFYLWHSLVIYALAGIYPAAGPLIALIWVVFVVAVTLVTAHLSYRFIERPFLRIAHRWR